MLCADVDEPSRRGKDRLKLKRTAPVCVNEAAVTASPAAVKVKVEKVAAAGLWYKDVI